MTIIEDDEIYEVKNFIDGHLPEKDGFESYIFQVGDYNESVSEDFRLQMDPRAAGILILSTPAMFDVSFRRWVTEKTDELGSLERVAEEISSPIQEFMADRLEPIRDGLTVPHELLHDHSLWPSRKPKILMQTCGHISGAAFYYQPHCLASDNWPPPGIMDKNSKFIGLSLHPVYGGHFAFRSVFLFPQTTLSSRFVVKKPLSILTSDDEARIALEKFNYSWRDSGFRDFGGPKARYSQTQVEFFGKPPADRWDVLRKWFP